jgi:hypothetical protein
LVNSCIYLLEDLGKAAALSGGTPTGHSANGASSILLVVSRPANGANMRIEGHSLSQLQQADIVLNSPGIVLLMQLDSLDSNINLEASFVVIHTDVRTMLQYSIL